MLGPAGTFWHCQFVFTPEESPYSYLRRVEQGYAYTKIVEEQRLCLKCGQPALIRSHFTGVSAEGYVSEFGYADRCQACEPYTAMMPSICAGIAMRARSVV